MCVALGWSCSSQAEERSHCTSERVGDEEGSLELIDVPTMDDNNWASWDMTHRSTCPSDLRAVSTTPQTPYTTRQLYTNRLAKPNLHRLTSYRTFPASSRASPCCWLASASGQHEATASDPASRSGSLMMSVGNLHYEWKLFGY